MLRERYTIESQIQGDATHHLYKAYDEIFHRHVMILECDDEQSIHDYVPKVFHERNVFHYYTAFVENHKTYYVLGNRKNMKNVKAFHLDDQLILQLMDAFATLIMAYNHKGIYFKTMSMEWLYVDIDRHLSLLLPGVEMNDERKDLADDDFYQELYCRLSGQAKITNEGLNMIRAQHSPQVFDMLIKKM